MREPTIEELQQLDELRLDENYHAIIDFCRKLGANVKFKRKFDHVRMQSWNAICVLYGLVKDFEGHRDLQSQLKDLLKSGEERRVVELMFRNRVPASLVVRCYCEMRQLTAGTTHMNEGAPIIGFSFRIDQIIKEKKKENPNDLLWELLAKT